MRFLARLFKPKKHILPCSGTDYCPYEYEEDPDREIEGMPFRDDDPRSCPWYGHICPEFMEDFGLTVEELVIRATIHCGEVLKAQIAQGKEEPNTLENKDILQSYEEAKSRYPQSEYPRYY